MSIVGGFKKVVGFGAKVAAAKKAIDKAVDIWGLLQADLDGDGKSQLENIWDRLQAYEEKMIDRIKERFGQLKTDFIESKTDLIAIWDMVTDLKEHVESGGKYA